MLYREQVSIHLGEGRDYLMMLSFVNINAPLICDKSVTTKNLAFLSYWYRKKRLQMHFNKYSVITQFAKLATGEQLCRLCTHRKL
jgi:hypothetical protein